RTTGSQAGNADDKNDDSLSNDSMISGSFAGQRPAGTVSLSLANLDASLTSLEARDVPLVYSIDGNTLTARAGAAGPIVFTFTINPGNGAYSFVLKGELDHPSGTEVLELNVGSAIAVSGGLELGGLIVRVVDDAPVDSQTTNAI